MNTQVSSSQLTYANYGTSVTSASLKSNQDAVGKPLSTALIMPTNGTEFFYSFLINVSSVPTSTPADVIRLLAGGAFNTVARMQIKSATGGFTIGTSKNTGTNTFTTNVYPLNTTHLVVIKYTLNSASLTDDVVKIFVNPTSTTTEPTTADVTFSAGNDYAATINMDRFLLRTNTAAVPTMLFGYPKAATSYSDLFSPVLSVSSNIKNMESKIESNPVENSLKIKLQNMKDAEKTSVIISDATGKVVLKVPYSKEINVASLPKGIYIARILNKNQSESLKFIKK